VTALTINNINSAVAAAPANSKSANKTVEAYLKDLEHILLSDPKQTTSVDNVLIIVITLISIQPCCCMFKIWFTPSHSAEPLFPTYKPKFSKSCVYELKILIIPQYK
jgi:hypothetical protein